MDLPTAMKYLNLNLWCSEFRANGTKSILRFILELFFTIGLTLFHLASLETYARSGQVFGISKSRAILCVDQVLKVLINC
jgi:hypothetical protein